jgi:hypothetical protein
MRRVTFILMIALLLLRGLMGEAMATGMALTPLQHQDATQTIATHTHKMSAMAHFDHETSAPAAFHEAQVHHDCGDHTSNDGTAPAVHAPCDTCAACQACNTVALMPPADSAHPVFSAPALPRAKAALFASAITARGQKPPIS